MGTLFIGNCYCETMMPGRNRYSDAMQKYWAETGQRMLWSTDSADVLMLAKQPDPAYVEYVRKLRGGGSTADIMVPDSVTRYLDDSSLNPEAVIPYLNKIGKSDVDSVRAYFVDDAVLELRETLRTEENVSVGKFESGGANRYLNSKSVFRAFCAGYGLPTAPGISTSSATRAARFIEAEVSSGYSVILKADFAAGGDGLVIIARDSTIEGIGSAKVVVLNPSDDIRKTASGCFTDLQNREGPTNRFITVERYLENSVPLGMEFEISESGITFRHVLEMRMHPNYDGFCWPGETTSVSSRETSVAHAKTLCEAVQAFGYRGLVNIDSIVTPDGAVFLTEFNGRVGGTTHFQAIVDSLCTESPGACVSRNHWRVPSVQEALRAIRQMNLEFDGDAGRGVVVGAEHMDSYGAVEYLVFGRSLEDALQLEAQLMTFEFDGLPSISVKGKFRE
jgi:hypothetical protein